MEKVKLPFLKEEATVNIEVDSSYYGRMRLMLHHLLKDETPENQAKYLNEALQLSDDNIDSVEPVVIHLQTLMLLLRKIEEEFDKKDLIEYKEIEVPTKTQD